LNKTVIAILFPVSARKKNSTFYLAIDRGTYGSQLKFLTSPSVIAKLNHKQELKSLDLPRGYYAILLMEQVPEQPGTEQWLTTHTHPSCLTYYAYKNTVCITLMGLSCISCISCNEHA